MLAKTCYLYKWVGTKVALMIVSFLPYEDRPRLTRIGEGSHEEMLLLKSVFEKDLTNVS